MADATNLRISLRLILGPKRLGRSLDLVLNMIVFARQRGMEINLDKLSAKLGIP